jgi:hypothetical protein
LQMLIIREASFSVTFFAITFGGCLMNKSRR